MLTRPPGGVTMCKACDGAGIIGGVHFIQKHGPFDAMCGWRLHSVKTSTTHTAKVTCLWCLYWLAQEVEQALENAQ